ncbi:PH domain-containing protein [Rhodohalobacter sp.]|uniref:PH domain-containing protein n=1 Tax=Rhodohalobacter sp. TaxID=1974210 RepID=UPI002ACDDEF9|nr:PH domain-containing protein [Rhodohalobacter sp.]MDZ7756935.1 PH domain-containing protein [Rhodohalobacter sp.]
MIDFKNPSFVKLKSSPEYGRNVEAIFIEGEKTLGAYKGVRDGVVFTNKRIIALNVQGITGKKKDYTSLPYKNITAFSVETAGTFDRDAELDVWMSGLGKVRFEFKGMSNILEISKFISSFAL